MRKYKIAILAISSIIYTACGGGSSIGGEATELLNAQKKLVGSWLPDIADQNGCISNGVSNFSQYQATIFENNSTYKYIEKEFNDSNCSEANLTYDVEIYGDYAIIGKDKSNDGKDAYVLELIHTGSTIKKGTISDPDIFNTGQTYQLLVYFNSDNNISASHLSKDDINKTLRYILIKK